VLSVAEDISDPATAEKVINAGLAEFGRVDTLVNHAGVFVAKPFTDYTAEDYATVIGVNLAEFFNVTQRVIEPMFKQGTGNVANITTSLITTPSLGHQAADH
jgi:NADP-dependent 3-hydroxy acid dehydrogenase YdfG